MNILDNSIILEKIYCFSDWKTKQNLQHVFSDTNSLKIIEHFSRRRNQNWHCHLCIYELFMFYATGCSIYAKYLRDSTVYFSSTGKIVKSIPSSFGRISSKILVNVKLGYALKPQCFW